MTKGTFKIFYTSDTHGYLFPTDYVTSDIKPLGLLNCIHNYRYKDGNAIVIDGGDTLQGSPFVKYYIDNQDKYPDDPIASVFNAGGYDYVVPGNHDFDFGYGVLKKYLTSLKAKCLCANLHDWTGGIDFIKSEIRTLPNGLRIGLVGVVTDHVKVWLSETSLENFDICEPFEAASREFEKIKGECDVTICVYHGGFENDLITGEILETHGENVGYRICRDLSFDILLAAHQHMEHPGRYVCKTYALQLPANAAKYAELTVELTNGVKKIDSRLIGVGAGSHKPAYKITSLEQEVQSWLGTKAGTFQTPLPVTDHLDMAKNGSPVADFFQQVMLDYTKADICSENLKSTLVGFEKEITIRELLAAYPFFNSLVVLEVDEGTLRCFW